MLVFLEQESQDGWSNMSEKVVETTLERIGERM